MADLNNNIAGLNNLSYQKILNTDIFALIGAEGMSKQKKQELEAKIFDTIRNRVTARINDALSDQEAEMWQKLQSQEEKEKFLNSRDININKIMVEETLIYKMELISLSKQMQDKLKKK